MRKKGSVIGNGGVPGKEGSALCKGKCLGHGGKCHGHGGSSWQRG